MYNLDMSATQIILYKNYDDRPETIDDYNKYLVEGNVGKYIEITDMNEYGQPDEIPIYLIEKDDNNNIVFKKDEVNSSSLTDYTPLLNDSPSKESVPTNNKRKRDESPTDNNVSKKRGGKIKSKKPQKKTRRVRRRSRKTNRR